MTRSLIPSLRAAVAWLLGQRPAPPVYVDTHEASRRQAIRDAEYQAMADAQASILRVSGKVAPPVRRIPAVVVRERQKVQR